MLLRLFIIELEKLCSSCFLVEKYAKKRLECLGNVGWYINHGLSDKHLRAARFFVWIIFYFLPACSFNKSRISVSNTSSLLGAGKTFEQIKRVVEKECNNGKFGVTIEYGIAMRKASNRWIMDIVHEAVNNMRDRKGR